MATASPPAGAPAPRRALKGYGPLAVFSILFLLMAVFVPTVKEGKGSGQSLAAGTRAGTSGAGSPGTAGDSGDTGATTGDAGSTAEGAAVGSSSGAAAPGAGSAGAQPSTGKATGKSGACADRPRQIPGDPYSPPCIAFEGDNGGATSKGVSPTDITISARILNEKGFQQTLAVLAGAQITDTPDDIKRTISALADFFNAHYQFYGRKIKIAFYNGKGSTLTELLGGGQAEAEADATTVADQIKAFGEINGGTVPFSDSLAQKGVIAFGAPYLSRKWFTDHRPYNWSIATDCSIIVESAGDFLEKDMLGKPAAYAGEGLKDKPRKIAALSPENPWYQECINDGEAQLKKDTGKGFDLKIAYKLDINTMSNQAASIIAKLKSEGITTVACGCDPIIPVFLTAKAQEQGYNPEWLVTGTAYTDLDIVGQLYDQNQWAHAFGVSYLGKQLPIRAGLGYAAYKSVRQDEPAFSVEIIFAQMEMLAIGLQMAGPNLTPQTFEQGMFNYPGGTGPYGTWGFGPKNYTPTQDFRVIWWNPNAVSTENNKKGSYVESYNGQRFKFGSTPPEPQPRVFGQ